MIALSLLVMSMGLASAIRFHAPPNEKRCLKEEIHKDIVVTGEYEFSEGIGYTGSVVVTDTRGHTLYQRENFNDLKGKFAFTADQYDIFEICVTSHAPAGQTGQREVLLSVKHGVEAKNYEDLGKAEKLKPLEIELRRLEDLSDSIVKDFAFMRQREEEMRNTNESTNTRVLYLSIFSMLVLFVLASWQMTTAHRPTFNPARGGTGRGEGDLSKLSQQYSSKDMPSHLKLKYRQPGQGNEDDIRRKDLRRELEDKEREAVRERRSKDSSSMSKKPRLDEVSQGAVLDADDPICQPDSDSDDDSDEDDTAALMAELERIKKERAAEKAEKEEKEKEHQEKIRLDNILSANPLLNLDTSNGESSGEFKVKRRWDDDVVFRNCAKGIDERKKESTFINDAIRSEFHKKFMDKYIK